MTGPASRETVDASQGVVGPQTRVRSSIRWMMRVRRAVEAAKASIEELEGAVGFVDIGVDDRRRAG